MYSLNRATILGNLTRDPEMRQIPSGQSVCTFGVATNRSWTDASGAKQEASEFHNVVAWGKLAEICGQYLAKGRKVYIEGRLQTREWEGQDGVKRYRTEIVTENIILLDRGGGATSSGGTFQSAARAPSAFVPPSHPKADRAPNPDDEIRVEDIPF
ncbi:single-stranded DNA-binding protein [Candidatus Parcubacteria bacterium]|nr:single-stranded DNA-binding protein [Candidatus Parcubacteria bacterium]